MKLTFPSRRQLTAGLRSALSPAAMLVLGIALLLTFGHAARADIYVSDTYGGATGLIYEFSPSGSPTTFSSAVNHPIGLAFDSAGNLYENDSNSGSVLEYSATGAQSVYASGFSNLLGLAFDTSGDLFIAGVDASSDLGTIYEITPAGVQTTFASGLNRVRGLAFDTAGNLYVADLDSGNVYTYTPDGTQSTFASGFNYPTGLAFDASGNLFLCSQGVGVFEVSPTGVVSTFTTNVTDPRWLAFDNSGNLYVTDVGDASGDAGQGNIWLFAPDGTRTTFATGLAYPTGIVLSSDLGLPLPPPVAPISPAPPVVTLTATTPSVTVGSGDVGEFTVSIPAAQTSDLVIDYTVKGTAIAGTDYTALKGTVKIKAGKTSKPIKIVPMGDLEGASKKVVKLTLAAGAGYTVGTTAPLKVKIFPAE